MALRFSPTRGAASLVLNAMVRGPQGIAATVAVGTVSMLAPGATPTVFNAGTSGAASLNFGLPGTPTIAPGATTTKAAGTAATVANSGTATAQVYDFGIPRGADSGMRYAFETSTSMAAPASGGLRANNATLASATAFAVNATNSDGVDVSDFIATWDDSTNTAKGTFLIRKEASGAVEYIFTVTSVVDNGAWLQINGAFVSGAGALGAADPIYLTPSITGNKGNDGTVAGPGVSVDSEIALWSGTGGATLKRATGSGLAKLTAGVLSTATAGTDYCPATSGSTVLKGSAGSTTTATAGSDFMKPDTTSNLSAGYTATSVNVGTKSTGTFTPDPTLGNIQHYTNGGAHTLAPPTSPCTMVIECTNASAGALTTSGFSIVSGDAYSSSGTKKHIFYITKTNSFSQLDIAYVTGT